MKNAYPTSCMDCGFRRCCDTSMYTSQCAFFGPKDKKESKIKRFFSKFLSK